MIISEVDKPSFSKLTSNHVFPVQYLFYIDKELP